LTDTEREIIKQMILEILQNMDLSNLINTPEPEPEPEKKGRILALFTAGILGAKESCDALKELEGSGWTVDSVCTPNAQKLFYPYEPSLPEIPGQPLDWENASPIKVMDQTDVIVLGVLTTNTAAKIATGLSDNAVTEIIRMGLLQGKRIVAVYDACDMSHPYYKNASPGYAKLVERNVNALRDFGIELVHASELTTVLDGKKPVAPPAAPVAAKPASVAAMKPAPVAVKPATVPAAVKVKNLNRPQPKPVVTAQPVLKAVEIVPAQQADTEELYVSGILDAQTIRTQRPRRIRLAKGTLVTPLARDLVKQQKIVLVSE